MRNIISLCLLLIAVFASPQAGAEAEAKVKAPKYKAFYVFGDSLSDTGNDIILTRAQEIDPPIPPSETPHRTYYKGRFSNGHVAVEYLWHSLASANASLSPFLSDMKLPSHGGVSFAFGGSASGYLNQMPGGPFVPGTLGQIELFRKALKGKKLKDHALYAIWTGANDYLLGETDKPGEVVANITKAIQTLHALGARDFLIPNLPDLGLTPLIQEKGLEAEFLLLTQSHNALLAQALKELPLRLPGIKIFLVDLFTVTQNLLNENQTIPVPSALDYFFPGAGVSSCFFVNRTICPDADLTIEQPFAFWDVLHPTTFLHQIYGQAMLKSLQTQGNDRQQ